MTNIGKQLTLLDLPEGRELGTVFAVGPERAPTLAIIIVTKEDGRTVRLTVRIDRLLAQQEKAGAA